MRSRNSKSSSNLLRAVLRGDANAVRACLRGGAQVNERDRGGFTMLMRAMSSELATSDIVQALIEGGADVNAKDAQGWTALHLAAQAGRAEWIELLVNAGADVDPVDSHGNTPLGRATMASRGALDAVVTLLRLGANPDLPNQHGVSPRSLAQSISNYDIASAYEGR